MNLIFIATSIVVITSIVGSLTGFPVFGEKTVNYSFAVVFTFLGFYFSGVIGWACLVVALVSLLVAIFGNIDIDYLLGWIGRIITK